MIRNEIDWNKPLRAVAYLRMSSNRQNPHSPDQQLAEIERTLKSQMRPWVLLHAYRDNAISGRKVRSRPAFMEMLRDIKGGKLQVDLILVDTAERLGRTTELRPLIDDLQNHHGVFVLQAKGGFADPTTPEGRLYAAIEHERGISENETKAHQVLRGKRDAAERGFWPGGEAPFGYRIEPVFHADSPGKLLGSKLVPDPETAWIIQKLFQLAADTGLGQGRLAKTLNVDPTIPEGLKPFHESTVGRWLRQTLYTGKLIYNRRAKDIIKDISVVRKKSVSEHIVYEKFCEPLISQDLFDKVQAQRNLRAQRMQAAASSGPEKFIQPLAPGQTVKQMLAGLCVCAVCGAAMHCATSGAQGKEGRPYRYYRCPTARSAGCVNQKRIPVSWLEDQVVSLIRTSLFGDFSDAAELLQHPAFQEFAELVEAELAARQANEPDRRAALEAEQTQLVSEKTGLLKSLADQNLSPVVRKEIQSNFERLLSRLAEVEQELHLIRHAEQTARSILRPGEIVGQLTRLQEALAATNPTQTNIELSLHVDRITCFPDGRVRIRTCRLGILGPDGQDVLRDADAASPAAEPLETSEAKRITPRRRSRRRVSGDVLSESEAIARADYAADVHRFVDLADQWFDEIELHIPGPTFLAKELAPQVAAERKLGLTVEKLAAKFNTTPPTIRKALQIAKQSDPELAAMPFQLRTRRRWDIDHAQEVAAAKAAGMSMKEMMQHFGKSDTTLRKALANATDRSDKCRSDVA